MKKAIIPLGLALCFSILSGCTPTTFGVDNNTWQQLTPAQRNIAMQNYYQHKAQKEADRAEVDKINAENAPLNDAVAALDTLASTQTHHKKHHRYNSGIVNCSGSYSVDRYGNVHCD